MDATTARPKGELKTIGLVSFAHLLSHLYMLSLPPLFIYVREDLNVSFVSLGLTVTAYAVTTGLLQTPMGFLVNRIGGGKVLAGGLFLNAAAIAAVSLVTDFWQVIALMFVAGVGSSVFHPADYSILAARVAPERLGRALATHALGGNLGFVAAPPDRVGKHGIDVHCADPRCFVSIPYPPTVARRGYIGTAVRQWLRTSTRLRRMPMPSTSSSTTSPCLRNVIRSRPQPLPTVPEPKNSPG